MSPSGELGCRPSPVHGQLNYHTSLSQITIAENMTPKSLFSCSYMLTWYLMQSSAYFNLTWILLNKTVKEDHMEILVRYLTIILRNRAEYHLILSRRGRRPSWLNQGIFRKIEQDNCFIIQQIPIDYHFQNEKNYGSMIKTLKPSNT